MRNLLALPLLLLIHPAIAQPDTLYVPSGDTTFAFAVEYPPVTPSEQYRVIGHFKHRPERTAVEIMYKRGKPSGVYRAYFPDGKPLIFAVYGWGSLHGDWTEYDEMGRVTIKGRYRDGRRDGRWAFRKLGIEGKYKDGLKHGRWKRFLNGRVVERANYRNGQLLNGTPMEVP